MRTAPRSVLLFLLLVLLLPFVLLFLLLVLAGLVFGRWRWSGDLFLRRWLLRRGRTASSSTGSRDGDGESRGGQFGRGVDPRGELVPFRIRQPMPGSRQLLKPGCLGAFSGRLDPVGDCRQGVKDYLVDERADRLLCDCHAMRLLCRRDYGVEGARG